MDLSRFAARWLATGALLMLLAIAFGAFGAHALAARLEPRALEVFRTGVAYHQTHAFALLLIGLIARDGAPGRALEWAARAMCLGIVLFSGSLYLLALGAPRALGIVTPFGGVAFMAGWALVALHALRAIRRRR